MPDPSPECPACGCPGNPIVKIKERRYCGQVLMCGVPSINEGEEGLYGRYVQTIRCDAVPTAVPPIDSCTRVNTFDFNPTGPGYVVAACRDASSLDCGSDISVTSTCEDPSEPFSGCAGDRTGSDVYSKKIDEDALPGAALAAGAAASPPDEDPDFSEDVITTLMGKFAGFGAGVASEYIWTFRRFAKRMAAHIRIEISQFPQDDPGDLTIYYELITIPADEIEETFHLEMPGSNNGRQVTGVEIKFGRVPSGW